MTSDQVEQILDLTYPGWREEFTTKNPKFATFADLKKAMGEAVDEGCKKLGLTPVRVH